VFSGLNDVTLEAPDDDAHELVTALARSETTVEIIAAAVSPGTDVRARPASSDDHRQWWASNQAMTSVVTSSRLVSLRIS